MLHAMNLTKYNHISIAKLNVRLLYCKHGFLSIQYSKKPFRNHIFRTNCQIFDLPIIPRIQYMACDFSHQVNFSVFSNNPVIWKFKCLLSTG